MTQTGGDDTPLERMRWSSSVSASLSFATRLLCLCSSFAAEAVQMMPNMLCLARPLHEK